MAEFRDGAMRSGDLAARAGISKDSLRYYERRGLLPAPARLSNGYRLYPAQALRRVRLIRAALAIGFTVDELAVILRSRDRGGVPCGDVRRLAGEKLKDLGIQIARLSSLKRDLQAVIRDWDGRLASAGPGIRAGLLESLADARASKEPATKLKKGAIR